MGDSGRGSYVGSRCSLASMSSEFQGCDNDFQPMDADSNPWQTIVRPVLSRLTKELNPGELLTALYSKQLVSLEQSDNLRQKAQQCQTDAAVELLTVILPRKGPKAFDKFVSAIEETEGQEHLVEGFGLRRRTISSMDESARSGELGNSLRSKVTNLENENTMLEKRVAELEADRVKAKSRLQQKELIEMALRLHRCDEFDMSDEEFETSGPRPRWTMVAKLRGNFPVAVWNPPQPPLRLPFTVVQGKAIIAENTEVSTVRIVNVETQVQSSHRLPESLGLICDMVRSGDSCYVVTSQGRRWGIQKQHFDKLNKPKWEYVDDIPGGHSFQSVSVTACGKHMYIVGSMKLHEANSIVLCLNTESKSWARLADLNMSVMMSSIVVANNCLLAVGVVSAAGGDEDDKEFSFECRQQMKSLSLASRSCQWIDLGRTVEWSPKLNLIHNLVVGTGGLEKSTEGMIITKWPTGGLEKSTEGMVITKWPTRPPSRQTKNMRLLDFCTNQWLPLPPIPVKSHLCAQLSTCITEQQTLMVLIQTEEGDTCRLYEMDVPCEMT